MATALQENPLREGLRKPRRPDPCILVIFGGSGDLARRKLIPSLYELQAHDRLPDKFAIVGFAHTRRTREEFQQHIRKALDKFAPGPVDDQVWKKFCDRLYYISADFSQIESAHRDLGERLAKLRNQLQIGGNTIFYLASPPKYFGPIIENLAKAGLTKEDDEHPGWKRVVIEKPFGKDLQSARDLNRIAAEALSEENIFRVDHYLGKDTVQNILVFRFANSIFEPIWNRRYIDEVQITISESVGMEGRGEFYEETGALRDIVQNHMLQLISLTAMESPVAFEAECIRDEKTKVFRSIRKFAPAEVGFYVVRGQYGPGMIDANLVSGYRREEEVSPTSNTETYVAAKLFIDNWRWQDVPFYIRTGKRLAKKKTEIAIQFRPVPHGFFDTVAAPNTLIMRIQPDEGMSLKIETKQPGESLKPRSVDLDFRYLSAFGITPGEAYERLLVDVMLGDQSLFARRDGVEAEWGVVTPILQSWAASPPPDFPNYDAGSWGPKEADELLEKDGRRWRRL